MTSRIRVRTPRSAFLAAIVLSLCAIPLPGDVQAETAIPVVQARPDTGSRIRRQNLNMYIEAEAPYGQLTPQQLAQFRGMFAGLAEADEPAYPEKGLRPVADALLFSLADGTISEGRLFLMVKVDAQGEPTAVDVFETPSSRMSKEAATVLMKTRFKPGVCAGKPCSSEFPFIVRFGTQ